jgi:hypothetical protein
MSQGFVLLANSTALDIIVNEVSQTRPPIAHSHKLMCLQEPWMPCRSMIMTAPQNLSPKTVPIQNIYSTLKGQDSYLKFPVRKAILEVDREIIFHSAKGFQNNWIAFQRESKLLLKSGIYEINKKGMRQVSDISLSEESSGQRSG